MTMASDHLEPRESKELPLFDVGPESGSEEVIHPTASTPGGAATQGMPPGSGWPDLPAPIMAEPALQAPYPEDCLPADLEEGTPGGAASGAVLGGHGGHRTLHRPVCTWPPCPSRVSQDHRLQASCEGPPGGGLPAQGAMGRGPGTISTTSGSQRRQPGGRSRTGTTSTPSIYSRGRPAGLHHGWPAAAIAGGKTVHRHVDGGSGDADQPLLRR